MLAKAIPQHRIAFVSYGQRLVWHRGRRVDRVVMAGRPAGRGAAGGLRRERGAARGVGRRRGVSWLLFLCRLPCPRPLGRQLRARLLPALPCRSRPPCQSQAAHLRGVCHCPHQLKGIRQFGTPQMLHRPSSGGPAFFLSEGCLSQALCHGGSSSCIKRGQGSFQSLPEASLYRCLKCSFRTNASDQMISHHVEKHVTILQQ